MDLGGADLEEAKGLEGGDGAIDDRLDDDEGDIVDEEEEDAALYPMGFEGEDFASLDDEPGFLEGDSPLPHLESLFIIYLSEIALKTSKARM